MNSIYLSKSKITKWLGLTNQQANIIWAIYSLQRKAGRATPKSIIDEDAQIRNAPKIQKSNFFAQLKSLRRIGYVKKSEGASYALDFDRINKSLAEAQTSLNNELKELVEVSSNVQNYFKQIQLAGKERKVVEFLDYDEMYGRIANISKTAERIDVAGVFPRILYAYSPSIMQTPGAQRYAQVLWNRCIIEKELKLTYLSQFDMDYLFRRLLEAYRNPLIAYEESKAILENIKRIAEQAENLHLYLRDSPYGLDMTIPLGADQTEVFLAVRNREKIGIGSICIFSPELQGRFRELFEDACKRSVNMNTSGAKIIKRLGDQLDKIYLSYAKKKDA